jgi:hypothetical protein
MAQHARLKVDTELNVYFRDPHSPWQRGTNENTNGLLRQYFPKSLTQKATSRAIRLMPSWMAARVTKASSVEARFSKSLARRRFRPNQEKVRSTTHRRLITSNPTALGLRLTISSRSGWLPAAASYVCWAS